MQKGVNIEYDESSTIKLWDDFAEAYAKNYSKYGDESKKALSTFTILRELGNISNKKILDAGCGEGFLSRLLFENGAIVNAIDASENMIKIAKEKTGCDHNILFEKMNLTDLSLFPNDNFDNVVSCMVIQDVVNYQKALSEIYRVLNCHGFFLMLILHPCFTSYGKWVRDENGKKLYWKIDNYFHEGAQDIQFMKETNLKNPIYFHRTLTTYFRTFKEVGFTLEHFEELTPTAEAIQENSEWLNDLRMCHFLMFKLTKAEKN